MGAIFWVTIKEAMRKRTFLIMGIVTVLYLAFYALALYFFRQNMVSDVRGGMMTSMGAELIATAGLSFSQSLVMFLTVMLGAGTVSVDVDSGLIHGILSRPISRGSYIAGKILGLFALCGLFASLLYSLVLALGFYFGFEVVKQISIWRIASGIGYYLLAPGAMLCLTVFCSIRLKTISNGILALFVYILGNIGGAVEQIGSFIENTALKTTGLIVSLISPFNVVSSRVVGVLMPRTEDAMGEVVELMSGSGTGLPGLWMVVYVLGYIAAFYGLAMFLFRKKDIV